MSVAHLIGYGDEKLTGLGGFCPKLRPENIFFIGLREVMACEKDLIRKHFMTSYTMTDIERLGIVQICELRDTNPRNNAIRI